MQTILTALYSGLSSLGVFPTQLTSRERLLGLIRQLQPVATDKELIRLGPQGDGGYLVPDDLDDIVACFSPGVDQVSGFELDCANRGMQVHLADYSVTGPAEEHGNFHFTRKFVGSVADATFITMDDWAAGTDLPANQDLLLQMDIEGFEYETLMAMSADLMQRFRILVIEFHNLQWLWSQPYFQLASRAFEAILQSHACVHIHPNNVGRTFRIGGTRIPSVMEFTFYRRDRFVDSGFASQFPHPLDSDNTDKRPVTLPRAWYSS